MEGVLVEGEDKLLPKLPKKPPLRIIAPALAILGRSRRSREEPLGNDLVRLERQSFPPDVCVGSCVRLVGVSLTLASQISLTSYCSCLVFFCVVWIDLESGAYLVVPKHVPVPVAGEHHIRGT